MNLEQIEYLEELNRKTEDRRHLVHALFHYQCQDCKSVKQIYLGFGIERHGLLGDHYIPSPFGGAKCNVCGGPTIHNSRVAPDKHFITLRDPPAGASVYSLPIEEGIDPTVELGSLFAGISYIAGR